MLLPGLALALGIGAGSMRRLILKANPQSNLAKMPGRYLAAALLAVVLGGWRFFFTMPPEDVCRRMYYPGEPFVEAVPIANYLKEHTVAGDKIAVLGSEPEIFFYSGRRSASGYIYAYTLMDGSARAKELQQDMIRQIEEARPAYLVWVKMPNTWNRTSKSETLILDWAAKYSGKFYEPAGEVDFPANQPVTFHWGKDAAKAPVDADRIYILRRRAAGENSAYH